MLTGINFHWVSDLRAFLISDGDYRQFHKEQYRLSRSYLTRQDRFQANTSLLLTSQLKIDLRNISIFCSAKRSERNINHPFIRFLKKKKNNRLELRRAETAQSKTRTSIGYYCYIFLEMICRSKRKFGELFPIHSDLSIP